ncbi:MAG: chemotaxis protein CheD [bacterium]
MKDEIKRIYLQPGGICLASEPARIFSVVGSGVVITLFDTKLYFGGMNYYTRPKRESLTHSTPWFACPSIIGMLNMFIEAGSELRDLEAHIYGGAENPENSEYVKGLAERNIKTGIELLKKKNIRIMGMDIGGKKGRKIAFNPLTGESVVAKVNKIRSTDWYPTCDDSANQSKNVH